MWTLGCSRSETRTAIGGPAGRIQFGRVVTSSNRLTAPPPKPPCPAPNLPPGALALQPAPSHPYDSRDPQAAGVDDTCQQGDSASSVSDSRPASLPLTHAHTFTSLSHTHTHTHTRPCSRLRSVAHTHTFPDNIRQLIISGTGKKRLHPDKYTATSYRTVLQTCSMDQYK